MNSGILMVGDTRLGPWIYKTRAAIGRTVTNLHSASEATAESTLWAIIVILFLVRKPFEWFAILYLRITLAISRAQEYSADKLAVNTHGVAAVINGLKKLPRGSLAYEEYLNTDVGTLLEHNYMPPLSEGFRIFLASEEMREILDVYEQDILANEVSDPYDSHPPLRDRIRHAESLNVPGMAEDNRLAVELLHDISALEMMFYDVWKGEDDVELKPIRWEDSAQAYYESWRESQELLAQHLDRPTALTLDRSIEGMRRLFVAGIGVDIFSDDGDWTQENHEQINMKVRSWVVSHYSRALSGLLVDHGYAVTSLPGAETTFRLGDQEPIRMHRLIAEYFNDEQPYEVWAKFCTDTGLANAVIEAVESSDLDEDAGVGRTEDVVANAW